MTPRRAVLDFLHGMPPNTALVTDAFGSLRRKCGAANRGRPIAVEK